MRIMQGDEGDPSGLISRATRLRLKVIECYQNAELAKSQVMLEHFTFLAIAQEELADQVEHIERQETSKRDQD
jgi:hypothetical protein